LALTLKPMSTLLSPDAAPGSANARDIADSFEAPEWYLSRFAANIRVRAETVAALTAGITFDRVLDIGCGDGSLSRAIAPRTAEITFLDRSADMLRRVAQRMGPGNPPVVHYLNSGFMEAALPSENFDLVLCIGVLAYVRDPAPFLAKVRSVLRPGGRLLLECTDADHFLSRLDRAYEAITTAIRPGLFTTHPHRARDVVRATEAEGLRLGNAFRYAYGMPVASRLLSQQRIYRLIRRVYGTVADHRRGSLGNQLIFSFQRL